VNVLLKQLTNITRRLVLNGHLRQRMILTM